MTSEGMDATAIAQRMPGRVSSVTSVVKRMTMTMAMAMPQDEYGLGHGLAAWPLSKQNSQ